MDVHDDVYLASVVLYHKIRSKSLKRDWTASINFAKVVMTVDNFLMNLLESMWKVHSEKKWKSFQQAKCGHTYTLASDIITVNGLQMTFDHEKL